MATPPTVLASASPETAASSTDPVKFPIMPLLVAVLAGVAIATLGVAGSAYYLVRSGRLLSHNAVVAQPASTIVLDTHVMKLEPLLVNLADASGNAYLRASLALRVANARNKKPDKENEEKSASGMEENDSIVAVRDTALTVLGRQTSDALLATDGKERLKAELKSAFAEHNRDIKVVDIFFTDFLVQR
jgi:flagellar FliL protein